MFVGAANGARHFHKQAALDMTFSTLRAGFVVGAALMFHTAIASIGGFVAAAFVILGISWVMVGLGPSSGERFPSRKLAGFFAGVAVYLLIINLLMFVDGLLLKRLVTEAAVASAKPDPTAVANAQEGFYGAVQAIARLPYQLILAVTFVIFPLMSKATFDKDSDKARRYVQATMRYSLAVVALLACTLGAYPEATMRLFYKLEYAVGASALAVLLAGYVCFSLFTIAGTIINGSGHTRPTAWIGLVTLAIATAANWLAIRYALSGDHDPLLFAAAATTGAMAVGVLLAGLYLVRMFGTFLSPLSLLRTACAGAAAIGVGRIWPHGGFFAGKIGTLASCAACGLAFLTVAVASGELRPAEILRLRRG